MKPKVTLMNITPNPVETMMWAFAIMHKPITNSIREFIGGIKEKRDGDIKGAKKTFLKMISINPHATVLEFVNMVWFIDGCSRAFQQQLTRTRLASYSIQSLRITDVGGFASEGNYHTPEKIAADNIASDEYVKSMLGAEGDYAHLQKIEGIKNEDARGVLPLNICSPIAMSINLRAFLNMISFRLCNLAQGEFREVALQMVGQVQESLGYGSIILFKRPCERLGTCPIPKGCGDFPPNELLHGLDLSDFLV